MGQAIITRRGGGGGGGPAGLNFEIVGGTTQPTNPKENMIWANTAEEITSWDISAELPLYRSANKNLITWPFYITTHTGSGITVTDNEDGTLTMSGTATANKYTSVRSAGDELLLQPGTYTLSGCPAGGSSSTYLLILRTEDYSLDFRDYGEGVTFTLDYPAKFFVIIGVISGVTIDATFKPQVEKGGAVTSFVMGTPDGQLWIKSGTGSAVEFNALKNNGLRVYPLLAEQFYGKQWNPVTCKSYLCGEWLDWWNGELYDAGNEYEAITGGWSFKGVSKEIDTGSTFYITKNSDHIQVKSGGTSNLAGACTNNAVDLSQFKTLNVTYIQPSGELGIYVAESFPSSDIAATGTGAKASAQATATLDISALSGSYYINLADRGSTGALKIYKAWLE